MVYDVLIIGGGPAGYRAAERAAADRGRQRGERDVGIAREEVGGEKSVAVLRILRIPAGGAQVVPDVIDAPVRPRPENLLPHGDGGVTLAPHARK